MEHLDLTDVVQFIDERDLVPEKYRRYYLYWIRRFLLNPQAGNPSLPAEDCLRVYVQDLTRDPQVRDWQVDQAERAVKLYLFTYLPARNRPDSPGVPKEPFREIAAESREALQKMRELLRLRHYSYRTEKTYCHWCTRFFRYAQKNSLDPHEPDTVKGYLSHLALKRNVSASTQNQAFNALLFLFRNVFEQKLEDLRNTVRAKRDPKLPVVFTGDEVAELFRHASGRHLLMLQLIYGGGLRLSELTRLRVKDIDFQNRLLYVRSGKGDKDRATLLASAVIPALKGHLESVRELHREDLGAGIGEVHLPDALARKYPSAALEWSWQYVFPSENLSRDPQSGTIRRHHVSESTVQRAMRTALQAADIHKHASVHTLRHSFASHLLMNSVNIRQVQEYLGHKSLETTMVYTHVVRELSPKADSPLDTLTG